MSAEENKAIVKKAIEERNKENFDAWREMFAPDFVRHLHEGQRKNLDEVTANELTGWHFTVDDMIAEGDRVAVWGTMKKEGKDDYHWCFILRFSDGKFAEDWNMISIQSGGAFGALPPPKE